MNFNIIKKFFLQEEKKEKLSPKIEKRTLDNSRMNTVLINPIISAGRNMDSCIEEKVLYTGNNTGNLLFAESMKEQLNYDKEIWLTASDLKGIEKPNVVMPSSNFIIKGNDNFTNKCQEFLDNTECPITLAGLGAQSTKELNTPKKLVEALSKEKIKFFKSISERAVSLGIRGEFTAYCLEEMGIYNYRIIGCPSTYKYFNGVYKKLQKPSVDKTMFTTTTGSKYETKLLELGIKSNSKWIMQMMTEMPEMAFEDKLISKKIVEQRYPGIQLTVEELKEYMKNNAKMFFKINDWYDYYEKENFTFAFGSRFHGNMSALRSGIPTLWMTHDSRTSELVNTLKLPHIDINRLENINEVKELIEFCDYKEFYKNYKNLTKEYVKFLDENGLNHKFTV